MRLSLQNCSRCRRVYNASSGLDTCIACHEEVERERDLVESAVMRGAKASLSEVVQVTRLGRDRVQSILRRSPILTGQMRPEGLCEKCGEREALPDSDTCIGCQLELYKTLGDLAADANRASMIRDDSQHGPENVREAIDDKRRRTGSHRFLTTPPPARRNGR